MNTENNPKVTCRFQASIDAEAKTVQVIVSVISGGELAALTDEKEVASVDPMRKLLIKIIPEKNFSVIGKDSIEIDPPKLGEPQVLTFNLLASADGGECILSMVASQDQVSIVKIGLTHLLAINEHAAISKRPQIFWLRKSEMFSKFHEPEPVGHRLPSIILDDAPSSLQAITCHFRAEMDNEVVVNATESVQVTVSREIIDGFIDAAAADASGPVDPTRKLLVQIVPKVNFNVIGDDRLEIDPPKLGEPQTLMFDVKATHDDGGEGVLWVIFRQGQVSLAKIELRSRIVKARSAGRQPAIAEVAASEAKTPSEPLTELSIIQQKNGDEIRYRFEFRSPRHNIFVWDISNPLHSSPDDYVNNLYKEIEQRRVSNLNDVNNFYEELRSYGADLFKELVPRRIQETLWKYRDQIDSIMLRSDEPFIPWEVVHIVEPGNALPAESHFLSEKGLIRWPYLDENERFPPPNEMRIRAGLAKFVIPDYPDQRYQLPGALKEAEFLTQMLHATPVESFSGKVRNLLASPDSFDLLHFACHGAADQNTINSVLLLQGRIDDRGIYIPDYFSEAIVRNHSRFSEPGPMIVLNACQVGRADYQLTSMGGFAKAFLERGASVFIGPLWSVGDNPALSFSKELYIQLKDNKVRLVDAVKAARKKAKEAGDATWLAYAVCANPYAVIAID